MISIASARPLPLALGSSAWHMMPSSTSDSWARICDCWWAGNTSMMRLMVWAAELVCSVREGQVARLGDAQRRLDRLQVAHFADEDDVGVLAQGGAQRVGEGVRVGVQLALVDHALLVPVQVLDRVLDRDHVLVRARC